MTKSNAKIEFGDFQTPRDLADRVCDVLKGTGIRPASLIEPTCGVGNFVCAALERFPTIKGGVAQDINSEYSQCAKKSIGKDCEKITVKTEDFFNVDWNKAIANQSEPILVLGNPPWVTNSQIGSIAGANLPPKQNFQKLGGFAALTGKSNFDISEWMMIKLFDALNGKRATFAMLCKLSVARKVLSHAWKTGMKIGEATIYEIDAKKDFDASVEACLLVVPFSPKVSSHECRWYTSLDKIDSPPRVIGIRNGILVSNVTLYEKSKHLLSQSEQEYSWRSGIKHDCSVVMELRQTGEGSFVNGLGEEVELERDYLYPLVKSSDVFNGRDARKWVIVTQHNVGDDTSVIKKIAPKTWRYLVAHKQHLSNRTSSIYKNRPEFSVFGIGDYSFSPWKVAVSGLYKEPRFRVLGTQSDKVIIPDDTVNFISLETEKIAKELARALNTDDSLNFLKAMAFVDSKRPYTIELLKQLDVHKLAGKPRVKMAMF